jgi:hypothetical protein
VFSQRFYGTIAFKRPFVLGGVLTVTGPPSFPQLNSIEVFLCMYAGGRARLSQAQNFF